MLFNTYSHIRTLANSQKARGGEWRVLPVTGDGAEGQTRLMHGCRQATAENAATAADGKPVSKTIDCPQPIATIFTGHAFDEVRRARQERVIRSGAHPRWMHEPSPGTHGDSVGADGCAVGVCRGIEVAEAPLINLGLPLVCTNKSGSGRGNESATNCADAEWMPLQGLHTAKRAGARPAFFMGHEATSSMSHWQPPPWRQKPGDVCNNSPSSPPLLTYPHTESLGNGLGRGVGANIVKTMNIEIIKNKKGQSETAETNNTNHKPEAEANETASQEPKNKTTASPSTEQESSGKKVPCAPLKVEENYPSVQQTLQPPQKAIADLQKVAAIPTAQAAPALHEDEGRKKSASVPTSSTPRKEEDSPNSPNDKRGRAKLRKLARQGNAKAQYQLALFLLNSSPRSKKQRAEAIGWLEQAAYRPRGNKSARALLSRLYVIGDENLPQDPVLVYARKHIVERVISPEMAVLREPEFWLRKLKLTPAAEKEMLERFQDVDYRGDGLMELVKGMIERRHFAQADVLSPWKLVDELARLVVTGLKAMDEGRLEELLQNECVEEIHLSTEQAQKLAARFRKEEGDNGADAAEGLDPLRVDDEGALSFAEDELSVLQAFIHEELPELVKPREGQGKRTLMFIVDRENSETEEASPAPDEEDPVEIA